MCNVLIVCKSEFPTEKEKKEFQESKRIEVRRKKTNPVIQFVFGNDRKANKQIQNFQKKHKHGEVQTIESIEEVGVAC